MFGPWTTLGDLRKGAIFETRDGIRAVKSEYHYGNGPGSQCQCVLLESGEYAHFLGRNREEVREIDLNALLARVAALEGVVADITQDTLPQGAALRDAFARGHRAGQERMRTRVALALPERSSNYVRAFAIEEPK